MKKAKSDEYWPPRPGSWEEAVDPYEVQGSRLSRESRQEDRPELRTEALADHRQDYRMPASV